MMTTAEHLLHAPDEAAQSGIRSSALSVRRFTLDEYHRLIELGFFDNTERIELINGYLISMSPINPPHAACTSHLVGLLHGCFDSDVVIRSQSPITLPDLVSEPEPDIVVARPDANYYADRHPGGDDILLLIEVSDTTLASDRTTKGSTYAAAGIQEYWIANLLERQIEVYQSPMPPVDGVTDYQTRIIYRGADVITPQALPDCRIAVEQIIPKRES